MIDSYLNIILYLNLSTSYENRSCELAVSIMYVTIRLKEHDGNVPLPSNLSESHTLQTVILYVCTCIFRIVLSTQLSLSLIPLDWDLPPRLKWKYNLLSIINSDRNIEHVFNKEYRMSLSDLLRACLAPFASKFSRLPLALKRLNSKRQNLNYVSRQISFKFHAIESRL